MRIGARNKDPVVVDALADAAKRAAKDEAVAALVAAADTTPQAWEALGERRKSQAERSRDARAEALSDALRERWAAVKKGRALVAAGTPVTPAVVARFVQLHTERLELRWKLEACVFAGAKDNPRRLAALCDAEVGDALGQEWPGEKLQEWMGTVTAAVETADAGMVRRACLWAVELAVNQVYGVTE